jgi:hypothetical protein
MTKTYTTIREREESRIEDILLVNYLFSIGNLKCVICQSH